jgi:hypothetical protein
MSLCYHEFLQTLICIKTLTSQSANTPLVTEELLASRDIQQWQESYPSRDTQISQKSHSNLKILGARRIT